MGKPDGWSVVTLEGDSENDHGVRFWVASMDDGDRSTVQFADEPVEPAISKPRTS